MSENETANSIKSDTLNGWQSAKSWMPDWGKQAVHLAVAALVGVAVTEYWQSTGRTSRLETQLQKQAEELKELDESKANQKHLEATLLNVQNLVNTNIAGIADLRTKHETVVPETQATSTTVLAHEKSLDALKTQNEQQSQEIAALRERIAKLEASTMQAVK
jgi:hypothetical protein